MEEYFNELRRNVIEEWESTYYSNTGICISHVENRERLEGLYMLYGDQEILDLIPFYPALQAYQTHNFKNIISRVIIGGRLSETRLIADLDYDGILINGFRRNLTIYQSQEEVFTPRLRDFYIDFVPYLPEEPDIPPCEAKQLYYITAYDKPMSELQEYIDEGGEPE